LTNLKRVANSGNLNHSHLMIVSAEPADWTVQIGDCQMDALSSSSTVPAWRDRLGRGLMFLASIGAVGAFVSSVPVVRSASPETLWVETWRMFGFLVFAGMFALVALRPRASAGVWELAFFHKLAMAVTALLASNARDAVMAGTVDAVLVVFIGAAYFCTGGWQSWQTSAHQRGSGPPTSP
jgi:hypothetical protein